MDKYTTLLGRLLMVPIFIMAGGRLFIAAHGAGALSIDALPSQRWQDTRPHRSALVYTPLV